ncbi:MAG: FAD-dependent oxidoreductase [Rickettsiales bacterium]|nr:FAD-dependent oxidoreductase [Rickettsiales bacterium]
MIEQPKGTVYIVGGGIAGIASAYQIVKQSEVEHKAPPKIVILDRNPDIAQGASQAYGGFITANSYLTVDFANAEQARSKLETPYIGDQEAAGQAHTRGWALKTKPSATETHWINAVAQCADRPNKKEQELVYHRFGLSCAAEWEAFFKENPKLADQCSFHFSDGEKPGEGILKIYEPNSDTAKIPKDIAFLKKVGGAAAHTRQISPEEAQTYCPAITTQSEQYGDKATYVVQHGGNMNGHVFCKEMLAYLKGKTDIEFIANKDVSQIHYGKNSGDITGIEIEDTHTKEKQALGSFNDNFVFASGPDTELWKQLGFTSPPVMGVAGTSLTVPVPDELADTMLKNPLKFVDQYGAPVMIPLKGNDGKAYIRVGGYVAFSGEDRVKPTDPFAQDFLKRQLHLLEKLYPELAKHFVEHELHGDVGNLANYAGSWAGRRPVTPDNYAIVDHIPGPDKRACPNGYILTGHGAAGLLAMGTADILAQMIAGKERSDVSLPGLSADDTQQLLAMTSTQRLQHFQQSLPSIYEKPTDMSPLLEVCYGIAEEAHRGMTRGKKDGRSVPYITHPTIVYNILKAIGVEDEITLAASFLHDVQEDCEPYNTVPGSLEKTLKQRLTQREIPDAAQKASLITRMCDELTNAEYMHEGKRSWQWEHGQTLPPPVKLIKIADQAASMIDDIMMPSERSYEKLRSFNMKALECAKACGGGDPLLDNLFKVIFTDAMWVLDNEKPDATPDELAQAQRAREHFSLEEAVERARNYPPKKPDQPPMRWQKHPHILKLDSGLVQIGLTDKGDVCRFGMLIDPHLSAEDSARNHMVLSLIQRLESTSPYRVTYRPHDIIEEKTIREFKLKPPLSLSKFIEHAKQSHAIDETFLELLTAAHQEPEKAQVGVAAARK